MHERFLESPPYDLSELRARAEGILRVEKSKRQIAKNAAIAILQNNSRLKESRDYYRKMEYDSRTSRPPKDTSREKKKNSNYSGGIAKRYKLDKDEFDCIFTMP